jgi:hypothetical protein
LPRDRQGARALRQIATAIEAGVRETLDNRMRLLRRLSWMVCVVTLAVFGPCPAAAQETVNYASVSGRVVDASGAVLPGATITARHVNTGVTTTVVTDEGGRFRFAYLPIGPYTVTTHLAGFDDVTTQVTLSAGGAVDLPVTLAVSGVETSVTVTGEAPVIEAARSQVAATVGRTEVRNLPLNGRQALDLALVVPGVAPANVGGGTQLFPETSAVPGVGLSVGAQRNFSNSFVVDGLSANDDAAGLSAMAYGVDAIDEFQVVSSGGQAELGRALGGYVNVVTRSGTNTTHADAYGFWNDDALNAPNALLGDTLPTSQRQYGGSVGGPISRNRTFYFVNAEERSLDQSGLVRIAPANVDAINTRLQQSGYRGPLVTTGIYPNPVGTTTTLAKIDHAASNADRLSVRYSLYRVDADNARGAGALNAPTASSGLQDLDQALAVGNVWTISPRIVNETRAQVASSRLDAPPSDPIGPAVSIAGVASFGTSSGSPTRRRNRLYEVVNNLSYQAGAHAVRAGVDLLYNDLSITYPRSARGAYAFPSLDAFLAGAYSNAGFTQTFGTSTVDLTNPNVGVYVQDEWKARDRLTLNAGVRYDLQFLETIHTDTDNVSPRLGFAWLPDASRRTVIRGSAGIFYDRVLLRPLANALLSANNTTDLDQLRQVAVSLSPAQAGAPVFPAILDAPVPSVTLPNLSTMDRDIQNASSTQASLEIERQLGASMTVSAAYEYLRGRHLIASINQNVPTCVASGGNNGCRPNPDYANNSQYSSVGDSDYHALLVSFVQRPAAWGHYRVSYTLSKSMNDVGEAFFNGPTNPFDIHDDWGRSDDDRRHQFVVDGAVTIPSGPATSWWRAVGRGLQVSGMLQYYSAPPINITSGTRTIWGTAARPIVDDAFIPRNAGTGGDFFSVSLRISRHFQAGRARIEALAEAFNLFNRVNVLALNGNFGSGAYPADPLPSFGDVTAVGDPRNWQIGLRVGF